MVHNTFVYYIQSTQSALISNKERRHARKERRGLDSGLASDPGVRSSRRRGRHFDLSAHFDNMWQRLISMHEGTNQSWKGGTWDAHPPFINLSLAHI